jgi:sterol 3beta-glucosyltransferase
MKIAILAQGTRGDIQPMLILAEELMERGHSVRMTVNVNLVRWAERSGVTVIPMLPDTQACITPELSGYLADGKIVSFAKALGEIERGVSREMAQSCIDACAGADFVVSTVLSMFRGMSITEHSGVGHGLALTFPTHPSSAWASLLAPTHDLGVGVLNRLSHRMFLDMWWKELSGPVAELRGMLGLPALRARPRFEDLQSVLLFSPQLVPRPRDLGRQHAMVGFCRMPDSLRAKLAQLEAPPGLSEWFDNGPAPVYFGFGSTPVLDPAALLHDVAEVTRQLGLRGLVGAGWTQFASAGQLPEHLFIAPEFDHDRFFPRCRAAVHHGGAGTTATALYAGLPSLVMSVMGDQPHWGSRLKALGLGSCVPFRKLRVRSLGRALEQVCDPSYRARVGAFAARLSRENAAASAADVIEAWAGLQPMAASAPSVLPPMAAGLSS